MKRSRDIKIRTRKFKVGDLVYWRRNAGKKVESIWKGPGIITEAKFDTVFVVKSRREVKVMHHDKLKMCKSRQLPKWLVLYKSRLSGESAVRDRVSSPTSDVAQPLGATGSGVSPGDPRSKEKTKVGPQPAEQVGPYLGTRKRVREMSNQPNKPSTPKRPKVT
ncbi:uncharacterized protein LOC133198152 [Saccostrea echinata]|uniref:uncharacterized protein LOC133198152 n=1 Tax=Saccostrea echinata TaxID=191078 RepID=UPI002A81BDF4|nr:uncharacterized protein LOC133198152 [Saccostrea echinata]